MTIINCKFYKLSGTRHHPALIMMMGYVFAHAGISNMIIKPNFPCLQNRDVWLKKAKPTVVLVLDTALWHAGSSQCRPNSAKKHCQPFALLSLPIFFSPIL